MSSCCFCFWLLQGWLAVKILCRSSLLVVDSQAGLSVKSFSVHAVPTPPPPQPGVLFPPYPGGIWKFPWDVPKPKWPRVSPKGIRGLLLCDFFMDAVLKGFVVLSVVSFCFSVLWWWHFPAQYWRHISDTTLPRTVPGWFAMYLENRSCRKWQDYSEISVRNEYILFRRHWEADQCHIVLHILWLFARGVWNTC